MAVYRDPQAPKHRVVFGGEEFVAGVTKDIAPGPETLRLFTSAGIVEVKPEAAPAEADKPAKPKK
ncbi:hypothetical protein ACXR2T_10640 [Leucobacter sp. HY1910]